MGDVDQAVVLGVQHEQWTMIVGQLTFVIEMLLRIYIYNALLHEPQPEYWR